MSAKVCFFHVCSFPVVVGMFSPGNVARQLVGRICGVNSTSEDSSKLRSVRRPTHGAHAILTAHFWHVGLLGAQGINVGFGKPRELLKGR